MPATHRHGDARACGATTIVSGQSTVFMNGVLQSVNGDPNTHGAGNLIAGSKEVFAGGILCVNNSADSAAAEAEAERQRQEALEHARMLERAIAKEHADRPIKTMLFDRLRKSGGRLK